MINRNSELSLVKQCRALYITRPGIYYAPKPVSEYELALLRMIDEIHIAKPYLGISCIKDALSDLVYTVYAPNTLHLNENL